MSSFGFPGLLAGSVGGLVYEASRWVGFQRARSLPDYMYKLHYWLISLVLIAASGIAAAYWSPDGGLNGFLVGVAGPAFISRLGAIAPAEVHLAAAANARRSPSLSAWFRG
jgi:hypothetical protein